MSDATTRTRSRALAALIGGAAVVVMGAVTVATHEQAVGQAVGQDSEGTVSVEGAGMTLGATATTTTPPSIVPIAVASPTVKATFYGKH